MDRSGVPAEYDRFGNRQSLREMSIPGSPDGQLRRRLKATEDIAPGTTGTVNVMLPSRTDPYFDDTTVTASLYVPTSASTVKQDDEVWGHWHAASSAFFLLSTDGAGGGASTIAITTEVIPGRSGTTPGGPITCKVVTDETGTLTEGADVEVKSWVGTDSPDPSGDWSGYIYISQDSNGDWWYHAVDCLPPPPALAVLEDTGSGTTIPSDGTEVIYIT